MSENVFWVSLWSIVLAAIVTLGSLLQYTYCKHIQRMAELGYQEEMVVGNAVPVWRKAACSEKPVTLDLHSVECPMPKVMPL